MHGLAESYVLTFEESGVLIVGPDGADTLIGYEWAHFDDKLVGLTPPLLFDDASNVADFSHLQEAQQIAIDSGADMYHSGAGDDLVSLPDLPTAASLDFDFTRGFYGEAGLDTINGSDGNDNVHGGSENDTIVLSRGLDHLWGDDGDDTFRLDSSFGSTDKAFIDGGSNSARDVLELWGTPTDYKVELLAGNVTRLIDTAHGSTIELTGIEQARFLSPIDNAVELTSDSLYVEMALLAREVYGPLATLDHGVEPLAQGSGIADQAVGVRKWHTVSALELGMLSDDRSNHDLEYSMVDGHYQATDGSNEANALVLSGVVDGKRTVALVFRGTDEAPSISPFTMGDFADYPNFRSHYDKFKPLVDALVPYLADSRNDIDQVLVSGHSLGAGTMSYLLNALNGPYEVKALAEGTPGSEVATSKPLMNFVDTDDLITRLGQYSPALLVDLALTSPYVAALLALTDMRAKFRSGSDVLIDSDVEDYWFLTSHSSGGYLANVNKLVEFARDSQSPFSQSALGKALASDVIPSTLPTTCVAVGSPLDSIPTNQLTSWNFKLFTQHVRGYADNDFVLGNNNQDDVVELSPKHLVATKSTRWIDGGTNRKDGDTLWLPLSEESFAVSKLDGPSDTYSVWFKGYARQQGGYFGTGAVGTITRIEKIVYRDGVDYLGRPERVQTFGGVGKGSDAASAARDAARNTLPSFKLMAGFDYADGGDGAMNIIGTSENEILFVGRGNKVIAMGEGDDIVIVKPVAGTDLLNEKITIDGGKGADIMQGGRGAETFVVDDVRDIVHDDGGKDAVKASVDYQLPDEIETLTLTGTAKLGLGNKAANTITGSGKANVLDGLGGNDTVTGGGGKDTVAGGKGKDSLTGGDKADTFVFDAKLGKSNVDTITDFEHGTDIIALDDAIFAAIGTKLEKSEFYAKAGVTKAHDASDRIIYNTESGKLFYDDDGNKAGGHAPILFATLASHPALDHRDFAIV